MCWFDIVCGSVAMHGMNNVKCHIVLVLLLPTCTVLMRQML
jgi:hypothetical protein